MVFCCREVIFSMVFSHPRIGPTGLNVLALEVGSWHGRSCSSRISRRQHQHHHHQKQQRQMQLQYSSRNKKSSSSSISSRNRTPSSHQQQLLKLSLSMGFGNYVRQFFAAFFAPSPSFTAMVFPYPGDCGFAQKSSPRLRNGVFSSGD